MVWILITCIPLICAITVIYFICRKTAGNSFRCNYCSKEFTIEPSEVLITIHYDNEYMLKCPHCNKKGWCSEQNTGR